MRRWKKEREREERERMLPMSRPSIFRNDFPAAIPYALGSEVSWSVWVIYEGGFLFNQAARYCFCFTFLVSFPLTWTKTERISFLLLPHLLQSFTSLYTSAAVAPSSNSGAFSSFPPPSERTKFRNTTKHARRREAKGKEGFRSGIRRLFFSVTSVYNLKRFFVARVIRTDVYYARALLFPSENLWWIRALTSFCKCNEVSFPPLSSLPLLSMLLFSFPRKKSVEKLENVLFFSGANRVPFSEDMGDEEGSSLEAASWTLGWPLVGWLGVAVNRQIPSGREKMREAWGLNKNYTLAKYCTHKSTWANISPNSRH